MCITLEAVVWIKVLILLGVPAGLWLYGYLREKSLQRRLFEKIQLRDHEGIMEVIGQYPFRDLRVETFKEAISIANSLKMTEVSAIIGAEFLRNFKKGAYVKSPAQEFPVNFPRKDEVIWMLFSPVAIFLGLGIFALLKGNFNLVLTDLLLSMGLYLILTKLYGFDFSTEYSSSTTKIICQSRLPWNNHIFDLSYAKDFIYNRGKFRSTVTVYGPDGLPIGILPLNAFDFGAIDIWIISHLNIKK